MLLLFLGILCDILRHLEMLVGKAPFSSHCISYIRDTILYFYRSFGGESKGINLLTKVSMLGACLEN